LIENFEVERENSEADHDQAKSEFLEAEHERFVVSLISHFKSGLDNDRGSFVHLEVQT